MNYTECNISDLIANCHVEIRTSDQGNLGDYMEFAGGYYPVSDLHMEDSGILQFTCRAVSIWNHLLLFDVDNGKKYFR